MIQKLNNWGIKTPKFLIGPISGTFIKTPYFLFDSCKDYVEDEMTIRKLILSFKETKDTFLGSKNKLKHFKQAKKLMRSWNRYKERLGPIFDNYLHFIETEFFFKINFNLITNLVPDEDDKFTISWFYDEDSSSDL
ncbi:hypothetical protein EDEG_00649 [Edhazardia aedis USNM 41457]|uniref:Uncharacterized protein n=1 Tax=Edhazardia aedis (strain USNM 41457) TaxID=1003232 RepID=J9DC28_EDHAE|nr:hypothetical protein EDEG_00649 [Edhazardia aedis USNM 41457]|eukprot:EJW05291.1 hypothetical protein EDEG_00649 [Edhazardia aedis USNM 41457]